MTNLPIRCTCGALHGELVDASPRGVVHATCYCDDCQTFARHVEQQREDGQIRTLDAHGGTEVLHISPAALRIDRGLETLACLRLTPKGPLRWYTECCYTPVGSMAATYKLPWIAFIRACIDTDDRRLEEAIGPVKSRIMVRYATGDISDLDHTHDGLPLTHAAGLVWKILGWRLHGDQKRTPFFDVKSGAPLAPPHLLYE